MQKKYRNKSILSDHFIGYTLIRLILTAITCIIMICGCSSPENKNSRTTAVHTSDSGKNKNVKKKNKDSSKNHEDQKTDAPDPENAEGTAESAENETEADTSDQMDPDSAPEPSVRIKKEWSYAVAETLSDDFYRESSGFYQKLNRGLSVNILVNGDSIGEGAGSTEGNSWTDLLKSYIESEYQVSCNMTNISLGGNGSYAGFVMESILDDNTDYDLILFCYGENDDRKTVSPEYEGMIRSAEKKYPSANMISILESSQREYTEKIEAIEELAEYYDIQTADTIQAFNNSGKAYEELTVDVKHPNDEGYSLYFEVLRDVIDTEVKNDTGVERITRQPLKTAVSEFDSYKYFPAEKFTRKDDLTYELKLEESISGIMGLYHVFSPSDGEIVIKTDGTECIRRPMEWAYEYRQDFIYKPDPLPKSASDSIEISFPTSEMADGFKGLIFTGIQ